MTTRIPWSPYEAVLLVDTCVRVREGYLSKGQAVQRLSILLRAYGEVIFGDIDQTYRNSNGIGMRMSEIEYLFEDGRGGLKNTSKLFTDTVALYKTDKEQFTRMLEEAKRAMNLNESNKELFLEWLTAHSAQDTPPEDVCATLDNVSIFSKQIQLSEKSLWQMENCNEYSDFCGHLFDSPLFRPLHSELVRDFKRASTLYSLFLAEKNQSESAPGRSETTTPCSEETADDSMETTMPSSEEMTDDSMETSAKQPLKDFQTLEDKVYLSLKSISDRNPYGTTSYYLAKMANIPQKNDLERLLAKAPWADCKYGTYRFNYDAVRGEKKYDFENPQSLTCTKPISLTYFDETTVNASSWRQLYVDFLGVLHEDYPSCFEEFDGRTVRGADFPFIADKEGSAQMRKPYEFAKGLFAETYRSANDIMSNLKKLLDASNVDYDNVVVRYEEKGNGTALTQNEAAHAKTVAVSLQEQDSKQEPEKITLFQAISVILQSAEHPLPPKEIYDRIIEKDLFIFKTADPVYFVNTTINAACRGSDYPYRSAQDIFGSLNEGGENKYFLLSRERELFKGEEKNAQSDPEPPMVPHAYTKTDRKLSQKDPILFTRVYEALKFYRGIEVSAIYVRKKAGLTESLSTIKHILDYASWSQIIRDGIYTFSPKIIHREYPIRTDTDQQLSQKNLLLFMRVFEVLRFYKGINVSVSDVRKKVGSMEGLSAIKSFLDYASWSKIIREDAYTFSQKVIQKELPDELRDHSKEVPAEGQKPQPPEPETEEKNAPKVKSEQEKIYDNLYSISRIYDDPDGLSLDKIVAMLGTDIDREFVEKTLDHAFWSHKIGNGIYSFAPVKEITSPKEKTTKKPTAISYFAFYDFLDKTLGMAEPTCRSYASAIRSAEKYAKDQGFDSYRIYDIDTAKAAGLIESLMRDESFIAVNLRQNNRFRAAFTKFADLAGIMVSFGKPPLQRQEKAEGNSVAGFDKDKYIEVLMSRYRNGITFDSIDFDNFREVYEDFYDCALNAEDALLERQLRQCGVFYNDRLFPAEGIMDDTMKAKLFAYIENSFSSGKKVLYYKAIFEDLADDFASCYTLADENMLRAFIEFTAKAGKYYFFKDYMSTQADVKIDNTAEVEEFLLSAGKPMKVEEVCTALTHIPEDKVDSIIKQDGRFRRNAKSEYFHVGIFEISEPELEQIAAIIDGFIAENEYAIWTDVWNRIQDTMTVFLENNPYLSALGVRNALSPYYLGRFNFDGAVLSRPTDGYDMRDIYQLYAKHHPTYTADDIYNLSKELDTNIYFEALYGVSVRVSHDLFVSKDQISFDVETVDRAIGSYLSKDYIRIREIDSYLVFPNVGYEWNEYLLESFLLSYSQKFVLLNNGLSLSNVAGFVVKKNGQIKEFADACAAFLADGRIELKKTEALSYLVDANVISRRSYKDIDLALRQATQIRARKG